MPEVIALGDVNIDIIARFPAYPGHGDNAVALSTSHHLGGSAANTAMGLARLGVGVGLIARVGRDPWGSMALRALQEGGVDVSSVQQDTTANTALIYIAVTPDGERTMLSDRGANPLTDPQEIDEARFRDTRILHLSGYSLLAEPQRSAALLAVEAAWDHGLRVTLDPGMNASQAALQTMRDLLPNILVILPSLAEAQDLTGLVPAEACAMALLDLGARVVALKLGERGCLIATRDLRLCVPAFPRDALDSTGAGDSYAAGLLAGHLAGLGWHGAAVLGNALGAVTVERTGAGLPDPLMPHIRSVLQEARGQPTSGEHARAIDKVVTFLDALTHLETEESCP